MRIALLTFAMFTSFAASAWAQSSVPGITVLVDRLSALWGWMRARPTRYPQLEELRTRFNDHGLSSTFSPLHGNTPFNNWLVVAEKPAQSQL